MVRAHSDDRQTALLSGDGSYIDEEYATSPTLPVYDGKHDLSEGRSWKERTFGPMRPGSLRVSIFTLVTTAIGAGVLSLPYAVKELGVGLGMIMMVIGACLAYYSLNLLSICGRKTHILNYGELIHHLYGQTGATLMNYVIVFYCFGSITAYQVIASQLLPSAIDDMGLLADRTQSHPFCVERLLLMAIIASILYPVCLVKNTQGFKYATMLSLASLTFIALIIIVDSPFYMKDPTKFDSHSVKYFPNSAESFFKAFNIIIFGYTCHVNLLPTQSELRNPLKRRVNKTIFRACATLGILYCIISACGYLSTLDATPDLVVMRDPESTSDKYVMIVGKIAISIAILISVPLNLAPMRLTINTMVKWDQRPFSLSRHMTLTATLLIASCCVAVVFPKIIAIVNILGGIFSVTIAYVAPSLLYLRLSKKSLTHPKKIGVISLMVVIACCGVTGVGFVVKGLIQNGI